MGFVSGGIRSVSLSRGPVKGNQEVRASLKETFKGNTTPEQSTLVGEILDARFVDPQTIPAYGTLAVTDQQGVVVRLGK